MKKILICALLLSACAKNSQDTPKSPPVERITDGQISACREYQSTVLDAVYTLDGQSVSFTKDPKDARTSLGAFDVEKGLARPRSLLVQKILAKCDAESLAEFEQLSNQIGQCSLMSSEINYFQGLAKALTNPSWPTDLKLEGKKVALDYVSYYSDGKYPLLNRLIALSVLDELSVNKIINEGLHSEIKTIMADSKAYVEGLRSRVNKDKSLSCESLSVIRDELNYSELLGQKIKNLLAKI